MFDGHRLYIIGDDWVFDLTEFVGYRVEKKGDQISSFYKAFTVAKHNNNSYYFNKLAKIPVGVMRKAKAIIENYMREALIHGYH